MHLTIENKPKLEIFVSIFQLLKNWSSCINMHFETDKLYIQSMDNSHICLADVVIHSTWFSLYVCPHNNKVAVDSTHFALLINYALKHNKLELKYEEEYEPDKLYINFLNNKDKDTNGAFDHFFELNLREQDEDSLEIPKVDYDVEFVIDAKKLVDAFSELNAFGTDLNIQCSDTLIELNASGDASKLTVKIAVEELDEYTITEDKHVNVSYSLNHLRKMCLSNKLSSNINISVSEEYPMTLIYNIDEEKGMCANANTNSQVAFYIAPKISDN